MADFFESVVSPGIAWFLSTATFTATVCSDLRRSSNTAFATFGFSGSGMLFRRFHTMGGNLHPDDWESLARKIFRGRLSRTAGSFRITLVLHQNAVPKHKTRPVVH